MAQRDAHFRKNYGNSFVVVCFCYGVIPNNIHKEHRTFLRQILTKVP